MHMEQAPDGRHAVRRAAGLGAVLFGLTLANVAISYVGLSVRVLVALMLVVIAIQATLAAIGMMHLRGERRWIRLVLLITVALLVPLLFLPLFTVLNGTGREARPVAITGEP